MNMKKDRRNIASWYYYTFYKLYRWQRRLNDTPQYSASVTLAVIIFLNFVTLLQMVDLLNGHVMSTPFGSVFSLIIVEALLMLFNYFLFLRSGRFLEVVEMFSNSENAP